MVLPDGQQEYDLWDPLRIQRKRFKAGRSGDDCHSQLYENPMIDSSHGVFIRQ